jgi:hypothetical protein
LRRYNEDEEEENDSFKPELWKRSHFILVGRCR